MTTIAKLSNEERKIIFQNVAYDMGVNPAIVEKDYWVCLTLYYLFTISSYRTHLVFKGGTCLSKVYNVIERFSEDIDLILDWRLLGYKINEPWENRSNTKQLKFLDESKERLFTFLKDEFLPTFKEEMNSLLGYEINAYIPEDDLGVVLFKYPKLYQNESILNEIRLEIGALAEWNPHTHATLRTYVADFYPQLFENATIDVQATTLERTFWEKITILHQEANRPETSKMPGRYSRHYYDVYCIAKTGLIDYSKETIDLLTKVADFKAKFYPRGWARYDLARIGTLKLAPNNYFLKQLENDYIDMEDMIYGEKPEFGEMIEYIRALEEELNNK